MGPATAGPTCALLTLSDAPQDALFVGTDTRSISEPTGFLWRPGRHISQFGIIGGGGWLRGNQGRRGASWPEISTPLPGTTTGSHHLEVPHGFGAVLEVGCGPGPPRARRPPQAHHHRLTGFSWVPLGFLADYLEPTTSSSPRSVHGRSPAPCLLEPSCDLTPTSGYRREVIGGPRAWTTGTTG